jgi:hypothetical protein
MLLDRVGADARQRDPGGHEFGMVFAELAKLAHSTGCSVAQVEEQHQR